MDSIRSNESIETLFLEILKKNEISLSSDHLTPILSYLSSLTSFYCHLGQEDRNEWNNHILKILNLIIESKNNEIDDSFYKEVVNRMETKEEDFSTIS